MSEVISSKIIELVGPRQIAIREEKLSAAALGGTQLLAKTLITAISSGTELAAYTGLPPLRPGTQYPRLVGYCNVAEVVAVGEDIDDYAPGTLIYTHQPHRTAFVCERQQVVTAVDGLDAGEASTIYLYHLGLDALCRGGFEAGSSVAVLGLGTLGLTTVEVAVTSGCKVFAVSDLAASRNLATELGATAVWSKSADSAAQLAEATDGGADIVVTTSSRWEDWVLALQAARYGGTVVVVGFPGRGEPNPAFNPLHSQYFYDRQLTIRACGLPAEKAAPGTVPAVVKRNCEHLRDLIRAGTLQPGRLISSVDDWKRIGDVYERLAGRERPAMISLLRWDR